MMNSRPTKKPERRGPFSGMRRSLSRIMATKQFMMAASLLIAIVTWSMMVASDGSLTRIKNFQNVTLTATGSDALKSRGYIVMDDLETKLSGARMTVEVTQNNYSRATTSAFNPHIELTDVTGEGENRLAVKHSSTVYGQVASVEPAYVTVNVERFITRRVPVVLEQTGQTVGGVYLDSAKTDPTMLSVSGPQSIVSQVARAVAKLDVSVLSPERMSDKTAVQIELQSPSGEVIASPKLSVTNQTVITDSVVVESELVPMKMVDVETDGIVTGSPAEGYELTGARVSQTKLPVAARQEILDGIVGIVPETALDITGATENVVGVVRIRKPASIENTLPAELEVTAYVSEKQVERTFRNVSVEIDGLDADSLKAKLSQETQTVQFGGPYGFINGLEKSDIRLFIDVTGLEPGTHTVPIQVHIDNAPTFVCALSSPEIKVTIRERQ